MDDGLVGVVLAAGAGTRLRPLSRWRPKALCPVGGVPLVDLAIERVWPHVEQVAVNLHHGAAALDAHLPSSVHRSWERPEALGTAGALGHLRSWSGGRGLLVSNADAWLGPTAGATVAELVEGWDRERHRLLCVRDARRGDFGDLRYCGVALVPAAAAARLEAVPSGLYEVAWREAWEAGALDLVEADVAFVDCGTPADYLRANLEASGGASVIGSGASVASTAVVECSVVWDGARVDDGEVLVRGVRTPEGTVLVR